MNNSQYGQNQPLTEEQNQVHHSFYAVIPAPVMRCKDLEPNAKLFYGDITALCNQQGYCWATNKYFCDLYDVDDRTIRRWVESLQQNGFIRVEINRGGFGTSRKIYISNEFQKMFTAGQNCPDMRTKMSKPSDKNVRSSYNNITQEKDIRIRQQQQGESPKSEGSDNPICDAVVVSKNSFPDKEKKEHASETIEYTSPGGKKKSISSSEIYRFFLKKSFATEIVQKAIQIARKCDSPIGDILKYLEGICFSLAKEVKSVLRSSASASNDFCSVPKCTAKGVSGASIKVKL